MVGKISNWTTAMLATLAVGLTPVAFAEQQAQPKPQTQETQPKAQQPQAQPQLNDNYDLYQAYVTGYDENLADDWYYDYYDYSIGDYDFGYDYYSDYDYGSDLFGWEESGLFE